MDKKKWYTWRINYATRKGAYATTKYGLLKASNDEEALDILWNKMGNDNAYDPYVEAFNENDEFMYLN